MKKHRKLLTLGVVICLVAGLVAGIVYYKQVEEERKTIADLYSEGCGRYQRFLDITDPGGGDGCKGI